MHIEKRNNIWHLHFYIIIEKYNFCIFNFYWKCIMYLLVGDTKINVLFT